MKKLLSLLLVLSLSGCYVSGYLSHENDDDYRSRRYYHYYDPYYYSPFTLRYYNPRPAPYRPPVIIYRNTPPQPRINRFDNRPQYRPSTPIRKFPNKSGKIND
jgi:hypothetical protein